MRHAVVVMGLGVLCGVSCSNQQSRWDAPAPRSQDETGLIVQSDSPIQDKLEALLESSDGRGRILSHEHGLYEIHGIDPEALKRLGEDVHVEPNVYFPHLARQATRPLERCNPKRKGPNVMLASNQNEILEKGVTTEKPHFRFEPANPQADIKYAFLVQTPQLSELKRIMVVDDHVEFTPDALGAYEITLLAQDNQQGCNITQTAFVVTANPEFKRGPEVPFPLEDFGKFTQLQAVSAPQAWEHSKGKGVVIAVVDTGVHFNHPDLSANMLVNEKEIAHNQIDDDGNGYVDDVMGWDFAYNDNNPYDDEGHGTHVAGLAASRRMGIAPQAKILAVKVMNGFGGGDLASIVAGIYYAVDRRASIINASFGSSSPGMKVMKKAVDYAESKGVLFVAAAGNGDQEGNGIDNDVIPDYPSTLPNSNIVAVAALDADHLTQYSNYGKRTVHVAVPGGSHENPLFSAAYENSLKVRYIGLSGTSMAAPIVSGVAALAYSLHPYLSPSVLISQMLVSGPELSQLADKVRSGRKLNAAALLSHLEMLSHPRCALMFH